MAEITLSSAVRNNLLALQDTADLMGKTQQRLATGKQVNSALDDPTAFFTAQGFDSRASDLNRLLDDVGLAVQTLQSADNALSSITDLVENAQATARQAVQSSSSIAEATGTVALNGSDTLDSLNFSDGDTVQITADGDTTTFTVGTATSDTVDDLVAGLDANTNATVELNDDGNLSITVAGGGDLTIAEGGTGTNLGDLGLTAETISGSENTERTDLAEQFDSIRTQIDELANDAIFNGVNLLQGDNLQVTFNEDDTSSLTVEGVEFDSAGLGINASTDNFQTDGSIDAALSELETAVGSLRSQASTFGSNLSVVETREGFTNNLINTLETASGGLTLADTNEEGANLLALQTRQQLASTSLSLASQADQNVLRLF